MAAVVGGCAVTGANRGIGLGLCRALAQSGAAGSLVALCRRPSEELLKLKEQHADRVSIVKLDLLDFDSYEAVAGEISKAVGPNGLNLLINNAGISSKFTTLQYVKREQLADNFAVNTIAPILLTKSLHPLLKAAAQANSAQPLGIRRAAIVNISSVLGSIASNDKGGFYPYRCSKSALNAATRSMSVDLKRDGIMAVSVHPGWVRTDMGGANAPLGVEESVRDLLAWLQGLGEAHNGGFYQHDGSELPW